MANLTLTDRERTSLRSHVQQRIERVFARIGKRVRHVDVYLNDVNGPRGGPDKRCVIKVDTHLTEPIVAHGLDRNLFGLVNQLTTTAMHNTIKRIRRSKDDAMIQKHDGTTEAAIS
jgi:putative sigma-54 modulation protein